MSSLPVRGIGKTWRKQPCAYCVDRKAQGCDHIFARSFFPPESRDNLPQAPACDPCALRKSKLETDLSGCLPFAANHADAIALLNLTPDKVAGNSKLKRTLEAQGARVDLAERSIDLREVDDLQFDADGLVPLFEMIVRGLYWFHWRIHLATDFEAKARAFPSKAAAPALNLFTLPAGARVEGNVGNGAFLYQGMRAKDNNNASLWRFRILGGVVLRAKGGQVVLDEFLVSTLKREFWERLASS